MSSDARAHYVRLVEEEYFGSVSRADVAGALACFTDDATVTIFHGDAVPRVFKKTPGADETPLSRFFEHLVANYEPRFTEFVHYIEPEAGRCAARFLVTLTPRAESAYRDAGVQRLRNCNFFECRDGRIRDMIVYYTNPGSAGEAVGPRPTGFPKA